MAYDGAAFSGWARQPSARTVQGELERAIAAMHGSVALTRGASRTDAGVHALGQVAAFDTARSIPREGWIKGLNRLLPEDLAVRDAAPCAAGYNPRFDTVDKTYRYLLLVDEERDPLWRGRAWHLGPSRWMRGAHGLDLDAMRAAAAAWVGTHDFRAMRAADDDRESGTRTMHAIEVRPGWGEDPRAIAISVTGTAFMKNMVRIMVGTLVDVGRGRFSADHAASLVREGARREDAGPTAPAHGLTLVEVRLGRSTAAP